jgi:ATP-dependent DNA helicase DinG
MRAKAFTSACQRRSAALDGHGFTLSPFVAAVREVFQAGGALVRSDHEQAAMAAQAGMAQAVAEAFERGGVLAVEAGTGVGKTWAYLAPLLMGGRKAWLSTATQALQDQLFQRDIPALSRALGLPVRAALLKGRSNYVCVQRLDMARSGALRAGSVDPAWATALERVQRWASGSMAGDLAELPELDEHSPLRPWISSTRENCLGDACPRLAACHVVRARRLAMQADWVVINHHLYIAGQFGPDEDWPALLPTTDVVVFDEAHRLIELGESLLGLSLGSDGLRDLARDLQSLGALWARGMQPWAHHALVLEQAARSVSRLTTSGNMAAGQSPWEGDAPKGLRLSAWQQVRLEVLQALAGATVALQSVADAAAPLHKLGARALRLRDEWRILVQDVEQGIEAASDHVRWIEWDAHGTWRVVRSAPDFAETFQLAMVDALDTRSWIFTSATLGTDNELSWFTSGLGLTRHPTLRTLRIPSPFDHAVQAALYVPEQLPEPAAEGHSAALGALVAEWALVLGGRTLVLTTSLRASVRIAEALRASLGLTTARSDLQVLSQGQLSKRALLSAFRAAGSAGPGAVMVASASFWQGVDLAGDVLQLLVIDKLPFPSPGDPLTQVRSQRARASGLDAFRTCYLDKAALALKQGAGRLIRSASDKGILVIADRRLITQSYGAELLAALPDMPRLMDAAQMRAALERLAMAR